LRLRLLLPMTALATLVVPATALAAFIHTVVPGESLSSIAAADGLRLDQLAAANGLALDTQLITGSTLAIPAQGVPVTTTAPPPATTTAPPSVGDGDADEDDSVSSTASAPAGTTNVTSGGSYV